MGSTLRKISDAVAAALSLHPDRVLWIASKLQKAGLLPADSVPLAFATIEPVHRSCLALAVAGAARPIDAVPLIEALERTPASEMILRPGGR